MKENSIDEKKINSQESILKYDKFAEFVHKYIQDSIARADQKSTIFFSFILFTFLYIFDKSRVPIDQIKDNKLITVIFLLMIISLAISIVFSFLTIFPRLRDSSVNLIYWESILANDNAADYFENVIKNSHEKLVEIKIQNCYELSLICRQKYRNLKKSIFFAICGIVLFTFLQLSILRTFWPA